MRITRPRANQITGITSDFEMDIINRQILHNLGCFSLSLIFNNIDWLALSTRDIRRHSVTIPTQDHIAWDQAPNWGKKEKKIGERSELRGSLMRGKGGGASAAISPFPDHRWARFARRYFSYIYFLPFSPLRSLFPG